jgi:CHASE3 domain sensor protein
MFILVSIAIFTSLGSYKSAHRDAEQSVATFNSAQVMFLNIANIHLSTRGYLLLKNEDSKNTYEISRKKLEEVSQYLRGVVTDGKQKELLDRIAGKNKYLINICDGLISLVDNGQTPKALEEFKKEILIDLSAEIRMLGAEFEKTESILLEAAKSKEEKALGYISILLIVGTVLTLIVLSIIGVLIANAIAKYISGTISSMSSTSAELAATVSQHERTAIQQASMVNETTATIHELGASSNQTSEQASSAADVAQKSLRATGEGTVIVKQAIDGMNSLGTKVNMIADQILKLGDQTSQLGNLANIIKDMSVEINMLALNAAVEAARAGEQGKGFAVVAGEIRKLANESKKSAEQANVVISNIQKATNATILGTEEGTKVVDEVTVIARNVGVLFTTLSEAANSAFENSQQVLLNAKQQAMAIGQVVEAMNGLNMGARETASGIVQTKTGIEQIKSATMDLMKIV